MAERPDFAGVLAGHADCAANNDLMNLGAGTTGVDVWSCGVSVPFADEWDDAQRAHLAAALNAELDRWLGGEGTRERVAEVINRRTGSHMGSASWMPLSREITDVLAGRDHLERLRAALTTTAHRPASTEARRGTTEGAEQ